MVRLQNQKRLRIEQERDVFDHTIKLLTDFCGGVSPKGNVAPFWETSREGIKLLLDRGIEYGEAPELLTQKVVSPTKFELVQIILTWHMSTFLL